MPPPATTSGVGSNIVVDVPPAKGPTKGRAKAAKPEAAVKPEVIDQVARLRNILGKKRGKVGLHLLCCGQSCFPSIAVRRSFDQGSNDYAFCRHLSLAAEKDGLSDSESDGFRPPHNRGSKLRRHAPGAEPGTRASAERLWACHHEHGHLEVRFRFL
ncbi:MAG: hypothetical protein BJ554DRAFT_5705 [Olpidium bornovanus]|uniref:Uncharacterized protein n=1 Tax=Olpidium bornovanus TaxID=278681 RepID=A0A8H7ZZB7_9FUNG|nr:MAG: hypothetical protein BJ554DRAFT_5705 [Olpidium bornovanus]